MHEVFRKGRKTKVESSTLFDEYNAYLEAGFDPDVQLAIKTREQRKMTVAAIIARRALDAMRHHDQNPPKKGKKK